MLDSQMFKKKKSNIRTANTLLFLLNHPELESFLI